MMSAKREQRKAQRMILMLIHAWQLINPACGIGVTQALAVLFLMPEQRQGAELLLPNALDMDMEA